MYSKEDVEAQKATYPNRIFVDIDRDEITLYLNEYKTKDTHGEKTIKIKHLLLKEAVFKYL